MEQVKIVVTIIVTIGGALWGIYKVLRKPVMKWYEKKSYIYSTGHSLINSIDKEFGKDAGMVIKALIQQQSRDFKTTDIRLQKIESHAQLGIYACEPDGKCKFVNPALAEIFEMDREEMSGYGWLKNVVDKETAFENWKFCVNAAIPYSDTYEIKTEKGIKKIYTEATPSFEHNILIGYVGIIKIQEI
jgi:PAS domain-containing protein